MDLSKVDYTAKGPVRLTRRRTLAPCEVRRKEKKEWLAAVKRKSGEAEYYKALGLLSLDDYWLFLTEVLDYRFLDPWDHGEEVIPFIEENIGRYSILMLPRGAMKTGSITVPIIPWLIAKDPTLRSFTVNVRETRAEFFARQQAEILASARFQRCFPYIVPSAKWGASGYYLDLKDEHEAATGRVDPNITSYGTSGNVTGSHVRAVIHDDLINEDTYTRPVELEKAERIFKESMNCLDPGGTFLCCCTRWTYGEVYGKVENGEIISPSGGKFAILKRGAERVVLDDNNQPVVEIFNPHRVYVDYRGAQQQVGYTPEFLEAQKHNLGQLYHSIYMNTPVSDGDRLLNINNIKEFPRLDFDLGPVARVGIETEATSVIFYAEFLKLMKESGRSFNLEKLKASKRDKHERIRAVIGPVLEASKLNVREDLWHSGNNIGKEMQEFDKGEDDALDALTYVLLRAPKQMPGQLPCPYIAVDPAFTINKHSNHTAVLCGCWYGDEFYILDCYKFKAQKIDIIANQIFKMFDKYNRKTGVRVQTTASRRFVSTGNDRTRGSTRSRREAAIWGNGYYDEMGDFDGTKERKD